MTSNIKNNYNTALLKMVWQKGKIIPNWDPDQYRMDAAGAIMCYDDYGDPDTMYGWEIDHIKPKAKGGSDDLCNLQPLLCANNRSKGDDYPCWTAVKTGYAGYNIDVEKIIEQHVPSIV